MSLTYIRHAYSVPARKGQRVRYTGNCARGGEARLGTITGASGQYLRIRMDGDRLSNIYHPTWELEFVEDRT